jgi:Uma2 family endonuclease
MSLTLSRIELPVRIKTDTPMSDDEFMIFCAANEPTRFERDANGEIVAMSPAGNRTGRKNAYVVQVLGNWSDADGRGYHFDSSTGFTLPDGSVRSPDASWIEARRWDALSEDEKDSFSAITPNFVVELLSPSDSRAQLQRKMEQWIANGAEVAWLIDPVEKTVAIYRPNGEPEHLNEPTSVQGSGPIAGFELVMSRIWQ